LLEGILLIVFVLQTEQILILEEQVPRTHWDLRGRSVLGGKTWDLDIGEVTWLLAWLGQLLIKFVVHLMQLLIQHGSIVEGAHGGHDHVGRAYCPFLKSIFVVVRELELLLETDGCLLTKVVLLGVVGTLF
jgi:hypothetical protein